MYRASASQRMFAINVTGSFLCAREAVKRMSTKHGGKGGAIVNVSSMAAKLGGAGRVRRLRRVQGRDRHLDRRPREGSRRRGHPRQRRAAGRDPHRDPRRERRSGARRAHRRRRAAAARRASRRRSRAPSSGSPRTRRPTSSGAILDVDRRPLGLADGAYALLGPTASGKSRAGPASSPRSTPVEIVSRRLGAGLPRHGHRHREARAPPSARACRTT